MAKLDDVSSSLNVKIDIKPNNKSVNESVSGHKRRSWMQNNDTEIEKHDLKQKGSINPINKPHLLTPLINPIDEPHSSIPLINQIDELKLEDLRGSPLKIVQYIFRSITHVSENNATTGKMTSMEIMKSLSLSKDSVKSAFKFLLKNELVKRVDFKIGKNGWSKYEIKISLYRELFEAFKRGQ